MNIESMNARSKFIGYLETKHDYYNVVKYYGRYYVVSIANIGIISVDTKGFKTLESLYNYIMEGLK